MQGSEDFKALRAREILRSQGMRMTHQRASLIKIIRDSRTHLDADELYELARQSNPRINRTTVYRNLAALKELGLIETSYLGQEHPRDHFEVAPEAEHYHFRCTECGRIIEFESTLVTRLKAQVSRKLRVKLVNTILSFEGVCDACRPK